MAEVRRVKKVRGVRTPASGPGAGTSSDELVPDDLEELESLDDLEGLQGQAGLEDLEDLEDVPDEDLEELFGDEGRGTEEPPISEKDKERMAEELLAQSKRERELERLERQSSKKKRKVRDPRAEIAMTLTIIIVTVIIGGILFGIAYQDYKEDAESKHDEATSKALEEGLVWYFPHNRTITYDNVSGTITGNDARDEYENAYRMDGSWAQELEAGPITFELNWVYYLVLGLVVITGPNGMVRRNNINKLKAKEGKFPDFIRDLAEFWKGGLSMKVAVDTLAKGDYGALDDEVDFMATQLSWGVAFNDVLEMFLERVHTGLIERSIALIEEANKAGGRISDILLNVAHDAQEIKMLDRQREGTMKSYIFVTFISFLIYVIIIVIMSYVFLPAIAESTEDLDVEGGFGNVRIQSFDPAFIALLFFSSVIVQSVGGGVNAGIMGEGNMGASLWWITIFTITGTIIFQLAGVQLGLG